MSDARLRELERLARAGDVAARVRWRGELLRLRDPRVNPIAGDVLRDRRKPSLYHRRRTIRMVMETQVLEPLGWPMVLWAPVTWIYGEGAEDPGSSGFCYSPKDRMRCLLATWQRWAVRAEVVRVGEERGLEPAEEGAA